MSTAAVLCIGTELTRGELTNTNASWLAESLTALGFEVTACDCVDDDRPRIRDALVRLGERHDVLVCTGGLGPTTDDITSECAAAVAGVPLVRDQASLDAIRERMSRFGRTMAASNEKQADFPEGASVLPNRKGTAPGFSLVLGRARSFFMPGVPREMKSMFAELVAPAIEPLVDERLHQIRLRTFGMTESGVNDKLAGIEQEFGVVIGYRAHFPEIEVKVLARAAELADAERRSRQAADVVRERLGDVVYAEGTRSFAEVLGDTLVEREETLALAESCTGGLVSELVTQKAGASRYYLGGVVSYANSAKQRLLGVPEELLAAKGAVSVEVARAMAEGARRAFGSDYALALTGIAGPDGGSAEKPVGLVHYAVAAQGGTEDRQMVFPGSRLQIQTLAAYAGLGLVRKVMLSGVG